MNAALVGYGYWGKILERYLLKSNELNLVKIYSPRLENTEIYTNNISDIENSQEIDVVFIATPVEHHYSLSKRFLLKGKHVFCEKPGTKTVEELLELFEIAQGMGKVLYIDYLYMNSPSINYIKEHLCEIGKIQRIEGCIEQFGRFYEKENVYEIIGVHMMSAVLYILDATNVENLRFQNHMMLKQGNCVYGESTFDVNDTIAARIVCNLMNAHKIRTLKIYGEKGCFTYDMNGEYTVEKINYVISDVDAKQKNIEMKFFDEQNTLEKAIDSFISIIKEDTSSVNSRIALLVQRWLEASNAKSNQN